MKKTLALLSILVAIFASSNLQAQDILKGNVNFLRDVNDLKIEFSYDKLKVGKDGSEANYIKRKKAEKEKKDAGSGDEWEKAWQGDKSEKYQPKFEQLFSEYSDIKVGEDLDAKYMMHVETEFIEVGFNVGVKAKPALATLIVTFYEAENPKKILCKIKMDKMKGFQGHFDSGSRIAEGYAKAGKYLAKFIKKKLK